MKICRIATVPFFLFHHLGKQIQDTVDKGHQVTLVCSEGAELGNLSAIADTRIVTIAIARKISLVQDLSALFHLFLLFRRTRFDVTHSTTPKAGLLVAIAAWLARTPIRLHTFTGQAWVSRTGVVRWLGRVSDKLILRLNTQCYADSASQRDFLVSEGLADPGQISVIGQGSLAGVDLSRFNRVRRESIELARQRLQLPMDAKVIGFVGRVTRDKGICELVEAFEMLPALDCHDSYLVIVGPLEPDNDPLPGELLDRISHNFRIRMVGYVARPEEFMAAFDIFCLPSYREGFGNVVLEAGAMGIPTVGTSIVGLMDPIIDEETGLLVPPKNSAQLAVALSRLLKDDGLREKLGEAAELRTRTCFDARVVNEGVLAEYERLAEAHAL